MNTCKPSLQTPDDRRKCHCHHITPLPFLKYFFLFRHDQISTCLCSPPSDSWQELQAGGKGREWQGWGVGAARVDALTRVCLHEALHRGGLCARGHLQKCARAGPWHHSAPSSRQECCSERRGFVEERKETGGEEKEEKEKKEKAWAGKRPAVPLAGTGGPGVDTTQKESWQSMWKGIYCDVRRDFFRIFHGYADLRSKINRWVDGLFLNSGVHFNGRINYCLKALSPTKMTV